MLTNKFAFLSKLKSIVFLSISLITASSALLTHGVSASSTTSFLNPTRNYGYYGGGNSGMQYPVESAVDSVNHRLFVTDYDNNRVLVYSLDSSDHVTSQKASYVLGQSNFESTTTGTTSSEMNNPWGVVYDQNHSRLFIADSGNNRVLIYDLSGGISNGMSASYVLGQPDFTSSNGGASISTLYYAGGMYFDGSKYLYVADEYNNRVMIFDISGGITNGMDASFVLGQTDFNSSNGGTDANHFLYPHEVAFDSADNYLLVSEADNNRITAFDLSSGPSTNMTAVHVIGQSNFTDNGHALTARNLYDPAQMAYDSSTKNLYVVDSFYYRVLVFNLTNGITDGMDASHVIGQLDFTSSGWSNLRSGLYYPWGITFDPLNKNVIVADSDNSRILFYDVTNGITDGMTPSSSLAGVVSWDSPVAAIDHNHHRIFIGDYGYNRILVYGLDGNDQISSTIPEYVLGQSDFTLTTNKCSSASANSLCNFWGLTYDESLNSLIVSDSGSNRILFYNFNNGISNGMDATNVLGQSDFSAGSCRGAEQNSVCDAQETAYNPITKKLFVSDYGNNRVLVYDLSNGITNGMNASNVIGQPDFTSNSTNLTQNGLNYNWGVAYDNNNNRLFIVDSGNYRVLGYDLSGGITNNMSSTWVFGESDFTSSTNNDYVYPGLDGAYDVTYDPYTNTIWVQGSYNLYNWELTDLIGGKSLNDSAKAPNTGSGLFSETIKNQIGLIALTAIAVSISLLAAYRFRIKRTYD